MKHNYAAKILIAEDDEAARSIAAILIKQIEHVIVFEVENGKRALEVLETTPIDVVVTDVMMPQMDGFELVEKVRKNPDYDEIHIIFMTALDDVNEKIRGFNAGANDYITKPFDHQELIARVTAGIRAVHLSRQLKEANTKLEEALEFKRLLLGRLAHDLRTPITIIDGYLGMLREDLEELTPEEIEDYYHSIKQQSAFINAMCDDVLNYTAIEMGRVNIQLVETELLPIVMESIELNMPYAKAKGIRINLETEEEPAPVMLDPHRINAVFWNLINNGIKYGRKDTTVSVRIYQDDEWQKVSIKDEGVGIPEEEQGAIFDFFTKTSAKPTGGEKSLGLGLAITKKIVDMHSGRIFVNSTPGEGSEFTVALPLKG